MTQKEIYQHLVNGGKIFHKPSGVRYMFGATGNLLFFDPHQHQEWRLAQENFYDSKVFDKYEEVTKIQYTLEKGRGTIPTKHWPDYEKIMASGKNVKVTIEEVL